MLTNRVQDNLKEAEFFDRFTEDKEYDVLTEYGYRSILRCFQELAGNRLSPGCKVADLGCGTGAFTRHLVQTTHAHAIGIDISPNSIKVAQSKNDGITYEVGDITRLRLSANTFDIVIFSGVLHHFENFEPCLKEALRILKIGGCVLAYEPHIKNPAMWLYRHPRSPFYSLVGKTENEQLLSAAQVQEALKKTGFINIQTTAISGVTFKYLESGVWRLFLPVYNAFEFLLGQMPLAKEFGSFLILCAEKE